VGQRIGRTPDDASRLVAVYADESCIGNGRLGDNPGGAGGLVEYLHPRTGEMVRRDYWVSEPATTNNRMALRSVIEVARALSAKGSQLRVVFTSDSRYLVDGLGSWVHNWARRGWTRKTGRIENLALWREALAALRASGHEYEWRWVRGHANHAQNEYANHLATRAAAAQDNSDGLVPSGFEPWLTAFNVRDSALPLMLPRPFPDPDSFTPAASLPDPGAPLPQSTTGRRG
jgi:ribonuclease HI